MNICWTPPAFSEKLPVPISDARAAKTRAAIDSNEHLPTHIAPLLPAVRQKQTKDGGSKSRSQ
jgi:hypothetical protein